MAHLIDKDALVAEIQKRRHKYFNSGGSPSSEYCHEDDEILGIINSLEVKEVDLEKEFNSFLDNTEGMPVLWHSDEQIEWAKDIARHFYELGLKARKEEVE